MFHKSKDFFENLTVFNNFQMLLKQSQRKMFSSAQYNSNSRWLFLWDIGELEATKRISLVLLRLIPCPWVKWYTFLLEPLQIIPVNVCLHRFFNTNQSTIITKRSQSLVINGKFEFWYEFFITMGPWMTPAFGNIKQIGH